jgi:hypothetical protein
MNKEHCILVRLDASHSPHELDDLEEALSELLKHEGVGQFDGNEIGPNETTLFLYGADADVLFSVVQETLRQNPICRNARVILRYGGPGSAQREVAVCSA